jgi:hypothetical protein
VRKPSKRCIKCGCRFSYSLEEAYWDYKGYSNTKLINCPECKCVQAVKYEKLHDVNNDSRYYQ